VKPRFWNQKVRDLPGELYILAKIFVKAKAGAKKESVLKTGVSEFKIAVKEPAKEGKANEAVARVLAEYFGIALSRVRLLSGFTSRQKIFEIL